MDTGFTKLEIGGANPRQIIAIVALLAVLIGVVAFQTRGHKRRVVPNVPSSQSVAELVTAAKTLQVRAAPTHEQEKAPLDLANFDASSLVLKDGRVPSGKYPRIALDPFVISPEIELIYRAMEPPAKKVEPRPAASRAPRRAPEPKFELTATVVDGGEKIAILNDHVVAVGERVDGYELVDVDARSATLRKDGRSLVVRMKEDS